jgi:hypothetical protein
MCCLYQLRDAHLQQLEDRRKAEERIKSQLAAEAETKAEAATAQALHAVAFEINFADGSAKIPKTRSRASLGQLNDPTPATGVAAAVAGGGPSEVEQPLAGPLSVPSRQRRGWGPPVAPDAGALPSVRAYAQHQRQSQSPQPTAKTPDRSNSRRSLGAALQAGKDDSSSDTTTDNDTSERSSAKNQKYRDAAINARENDTALGLESIAEEVEEVLLQREYEDLRLRDGKIAAEESSVMRRLKEREGRQQEAREQAKEVRRRDTKS